ncbi:hypothetical protein CN128_24575 [Sinorhizobium meliloti]|uniref:hypothetical protein n=1 Tax=Rhizobium meliloti TaxID=382 RepID=UPI000FDBCA29|nr:hypothetical protein [Sinorhizobium meliloti]MDX0139339.1 hypothetical protein [Sinorhizobium meliloti]MDX0382678.1 hypothetical protein [Sinorhizobium meliloti]RVM51434.1 hypothetical protein CN128_24575 [Sinorhizobium meliloti]
MISFTNLVPEELAELRDSLTNPGEIVPFVESVKSFLQCTPIDGGADSDLIYLTGKRLARQGIWDLVPESVLASALVTIPQESVKLFLESASPDFRARVLEGSKRVRGVRQGRHKARVKSYTQKRKVHAGKRGQIAAFAANLDPEHQNIVSASESSLRNSGAVLIVDKNGRVLGLANKPKPKGTLAKSVEKAKGQLPIVTPDDPRARKDDGSYRSK